MCYRVIRHPPVDFWGSVEAVPTYPFLQTLDKYFCGRIRQRSGEDHAAVRKGSISDINWSNFMASVEITFALNNQILAQLEEEKTTQTSV